MHNLNVCKIVEVARIFNFRKYFFLRVIFNNSKILITKNIKYALNSLLHLGTHG